MNTEMDTHKHVYDLIRSSWHFVIIIYRLIIYHPLLHIPEYPFVKRLMLIGHTHLTEQA
jgi:hypothetical protein